MPDLSQGDLLLYTLRYRHQDQTLLNTMMLRYEVFDPSITDDYETFAEAYLVDRAQAGDLIPSLRAETASAMTYVDHRIQKIHPIRWSAIVVNLNAVGDIGTGHLPQNVAATFTKRTLLATRYGIGSWHQAGMVNGSLATPGTWVQGDINSIATALESAFVGAKQPGGQIGTVTAGLWSRAVPQRFTPLTSITPQGTVRVMRRRTVGVGI